MANRKNHSVTATKKCPVCKRTFSAYSKAKKNHSHTKSSQFKRPAKAVTCSKRCSKLYARSWHKYNKL